MLAMSACNDTPTGLDICVISAGCRGLAHAVVWDSMSSVFPISPPTPFGTHTNAALDVIRAGAGRCVACGMCLPHCPTYTKTKSELESPRGRISLMLAVAKNELEATPKLESHLSLCLTCRACETVCPAQVPFGEVMDATRAELAARRGLSLRQRILARAMVALTQPVWLGVVARLLRFYQLTGLQTALRRSGLLRLLRLADVDAELPPLPPTRAFALHYPARGTRRGAVALFTGCIARLTDTQTLHDSIQVLTWLGYDVHVPPTQTCCGALHRHGGDARNADDLMRRNVEAFAGDVDAIITTASGCGATLIEYDDARFTRKIVDISSFLQRIDWPAERPLAPLPKRIAIHDSCTLTNVLHAQHAPYQLLRRLPQAEVVALTDNKFCCGAAGAYHIEHKEMANSLRDDKIESLRALAPDILVSSNIGCAMHLAAGARAARLAIEIVHPVTLIARQLAA
jgi:glycolate oxidase iron-sulfur subunit